MSFAKKRLPVLLAGIAIATFGALSNAAQSELVQSNAEQQNESSRVSSGYAASQPARRMPSTEQIAFSEPSQRTPLEVSMRMPPLQPQIAWEHTNYDTARSSIDMLSRPSFNERLKFGATTVKATAATCDTNAFASYTGSQLVSAIKAADASCINTLFSITGSNQYWTFKESQMVTVADAFRASAASYNGTNSDSTLQLVLFLRAGYYVQSYNASVVGAYGQSLKTSIRAALDAFFNNGNFGLVNDVHGETLSETVVLVDSATEQARYISTFKRLLTNYSSSYNSYWWMKNAVNNVFTGMFRAHYNADFRTLVQSDTSIIESLYTFANNNFTRMGTAEDFMVTNAGGEVARFLQYTGAPKTLSSSRTKSLIDRSSLTGITAPVWVRMGSIVNYYDAANCATYNVCNFKSRVEAAALPISHTCSSTLKIRAQSMSATELSNTCSTVAAEETFFHSKVNSGRRPVANDNNAALEMVIFNSSKDYGTYAGAIYDISTNNGGMYLEGNPAAAGNQARFIAYEAEWLLPTFDIWNLTHEYIHYLDGRFDMFGDFTASTSKKTVWWIEGFAEYMSYSYRNLEYTAAKQEAAKGTYALSTIFQNDYNSGQTRVYNWGYLAVRYMFEKRSSNVTSILGYFRSGDYAGYETFMNSTVGSQYDSDFRTFLACVANPANTGCGGGTTNNPPVANFSVTVSNLSATFTDSSTDSDGSIASRSWNFGDNTTSTATNPSKTYSAAGNYTVTLTVTDNKGATNTTSRSVAVGGVVAGLPECPSSRVDELGKNCSRSNQSVAAAGGFLTYFVFIPTGTTQLRISTSGGTGNADLYYGATTWPSPTSYTQRSINAGNSEVITVNNPSGNSYVYIRLHATAPFSGVKISTEY